MNSYESVLIRVICGETSSKLPSAVSGRLAKLAKPFVKLCSFLRLCYICAALTIQHAMITFTICLLALIAGYFIYGRLVERVFGPDDRKTPALTHSRRSGLYSPSYLENLHDSIFKHSRVSAPSSELLWERSSVLLPICGLCWEVSLPVPHTIISPECSLCVTVVRACLKLSAVFWG